MPLSPKQAADDAIARSRAVLNHGQQPGTPAGVADDLTRSALVMAVAALDTYMHHAILRKLRASKPPPAALARLELRFDVSCDLVRSAAEGRRQDPNSRPWVLVKDALQERLLKMPFQSSDAVKSAISMCGVKKGWRDVCRQRGVSSARLARRLDELAHRRNKIVHESDLLRAARPRDVKHEKIDVRKVKRDINWLEKLVSAIDQVVKP